MPPSIRKASAPSPSERTLRASIAAHHRWALEPDRRAATRPARQALEAKFEGEVIAAADAAGIELDERELAERVAHLKSAHYRRLALRSAQARRGHGGGDAG